MHLAAQIKRLRTEHGYSQDELAERVFVSRQSVSNWENDRTYPDLRSLLLLSEVFSVSLDTLIKGDVERMKTEIDERERAEFDRSGAVFAVLFLGMLVLPLPLVHLFGWIGFAGYVLLCAAALVYAVRIERCKKKYDVRTYREVVAFSEGRTLDEIERARESGKRPYQTAIAVFGSAAAVVLIALLMQFVAGRLF